MNSVRWELQWKDMLTTAYPQLINCHISLFSTILKSQKMKEKSEHAQHCTRCAVVVPQIKRGKQTKNAHTYTYLTRSLAHSHIARASFIKMKKT